MSFGGSKGFRVHLKYWSCNHLKTSTVRKVNWLAVTESKCTDPMRLNSTTANPLFCTNEDTSCMLHVCSVVLPNQEHRERESFAQPQTTLLIIKVDLPWRFFFQIVESYKDIFSLNLRYAEFKGLLEAENRHMPCIRMLKFQDSLNLHKIGSRWMARTCFSNKFLG